MHWKELAVASEDISAVCLFTPLGFMALTYKAFWTNIRFHFTHWDGTNISITVFHSQRVSVCCSLSKHCGVVRPRWRRPWRHVKETDGGRNHSDTKPAVKGTDSGGHLNNIVWEVEIVIWLAVAIARAGWSTFRKCYSMLFSLNRIRPWKSSVCFF